IRPNFADASVNRERAYGHLSQTQPAGTQGMGFMVISNNSGYPLTLYNNDGFLGQAAAGGVYRILSVPGTHYLRAVIAANNWFGGNSETECYLEAGQEFDWNIDLSQFNLQ